MTLISNKIIWLPSKRLTIALVVMLVISFLLALRAIEVFSISARYLPLLTLSGISGCLGALYFAPAIFTSPITYIWCFSALIFAGSWEIRQNTWTGPMSIIGYLLWLALGLMSTYAYAA